MEPYQERVVLERDGLHARLERLKAFLARTAGAVGDEQRLLLEYQADLVRKYLDVLDERIRGWQ